MVLDSFNKVSLYYLGLSSYVKCMVAGKCFDIIFILAYTSYSLSQTTMYALIERWMDTTHTFYLPFREMIITLLNFAAITGLSFSRELVPLSSEAYSSAMVRKRCLKDIFKATTSVKSGCSSLIRYTELMAKVRSGDDIGHVSLEQLARCFLFYLLKVVIFPNASGTCYLQLLHVM